MFVAKKQVKRKFVTTHQLQQQQKNKKPLEVAKNETTHKLTQGGIRKSPRLNKMQQANDPIVSRKCSIPAKRKLDLQNPPHQDENMGENEVEVRFARFLILPVYYLYSIYILLGMK